MHLRRVVVMHLLQEMVMQLKQGVVMQPMREQGLAAVGVGEWGEREVAGSAEVGVKGMGAADWAGVHTQDAPD